MELKKQLFHILLLQIAVVIYSFSTVFLRMASKETAFTFRLVVFYGLSLGMLGIYAILWQQIIKRVELTVAYANRCLFAIWAMVWSVIFFGEQISIQNIIGVIFVVTGTLLVNLPEKEKKNTHEEVTISL